jgi:hypothetical protein
VIWHLLAHGDMGAWGAVLWCAAGAVLWLRYRKGNNRWNRR